MGNVSKKQLTLDLYGKNMAGDRRHAQEIMRDLGINYEHATPQSMGDCWWFWNCTNIPDDMPSYITESKSRNPISCIGWGLNAETAHRLHKSLVGGE